MKSFERLVEDKNRVIKDCDDFIKELKDILLRTSNISILIKLLSAKKEKYLELKYDNYKESALSVENLDEKIYRQIVILEKQGIPESNTTKKQSLDRFFIEYKDQQKLKFIIEKFNFIKNHYKSIITLLGLTPFIIYFVLNKNIGYIPMPSSSDIFPVLTSLTLAGLSLLFILYLAPIMQLIIAFCIRDIKSNVIWCVYLFSCVVTLAVAVIMVYYNFSKEEIAIITFILLIIDIFIYYYFSSKKLNKKDKFFDSLLLAFFGIISFLSPFIIFITIVERVNYSSSEDCVFLILIVSLSVILSIFLLLVKDIYSFAFIFYVFIITNCLQLFVLHDKIVQISDLGNIKYKYLSIDKSALDTLPKEVCDISKITLFESKEASSYIDNNLSIEIKENNGSISKNILVFSNCLKFTDKKGKELNLEKAKKINYQNKILSYILDNNNTELKEENASVKLFKRECVTYFEKNDEVIKLHNIKALSTLGKFYYLETKDGVKFELDSSKVISRVKE
ncbi:hypothetical protein [Campylobacter concisus]